MRRTKIQNSILKRAIKEAKSASSSGGGGGGAPELASKGESSGICNGFPSSAPGSDGGRPDESSSSADFLLFLPFRANTRTRPAPENNPRASIVMIRTVKLAGSTGTVFVGSNIGVVGVGARGMEPLGEFEDLGLAAMVA